MSETETAETVSAALNLLISRSPLLGNHFASHKTYLFEGVFNFEHENRLKISVPIAVPTEFQKSTVSVDGNDIVRQTVDWPAGILYDRLSIP